MMTDTRDYPSIEQQQTGDSRDYPSMSNKKAYPRPSLTMVRPMKEMPSLNIETITTIALKEEDVIAAIKQYIEPQTGSLANKETTIDLSDTNDIKIIIKS